MNTVTPSIQVAPLLGLFTNRGKIKNRIYTNLPRYYLARISPITFENIDNITMMKVFLSVQSYDMISKHVPIVPSIFLYNFILTLLFSIATVEAFLYLYSYRSKTHVSGNISNNLNKTITFSNMKWFHQLNFSKHLKNLFVNSL